MSKKKYALSAFVNIKGTFNYASFAAIQHAARENEIDP